MSLPITVDYDQEDWRSSRVYGDGELSGLWVADKVVVHWGGSTIPPVTKLGERRLLRGWQSFHMRAPRNWRDIAYNYAVGNSGTTYRARGWNPSGATSGDFEGDGIPENNEAVACVWLGGSGGDISPAAYESMGILVAEILAVIGLDRDVVIGHREVKGNTICPGSEWMDWIQEEGWLAAQEDDMQSNLAALQAQTMEWYVNLQALTGHPGGIAQYWGSDYDGHLTNGVTPSDQEWLNAYEELWTAHVTASVSVGRKGDKGDKGDTGQINLSQLDARYASKSHPHTIT